MRDEQIEHWIKLAEEAHLDPTKEYPRRVIALGEELLRVRRKLREIVLRAGQS